MEMEEFKMSYAIEMVETAAQPVIYQKHVTSVDQLPLVIGKAYESVFGYLYERGEQPADMPFIAYYNMDMAALEVEIGVPVSRVFEETPDIHSGEIPAGKKVISMYQGPYSGMTAIYDAMNQWMAERSIEPTGVVYEFYYNSPEEVPESELLTKVVFLVK
jgi:effector-binding domain-containing protein